MSYVEKFNPQKRSGCINLVLLGTVVSLCGYGIHSCSQDEENDWVADSEVTQVQGGHMYQNNHYVHGAGYYHAPFAAWFSRPYNDYDPARGVLRGRELEQPGLCLEYHLLRPCRRNRFPGEQPVAERESRAGRQPEGLHRQRPVHFAWRLRFVLPRRQFLT